MKPPRTLEELSNHEDPVDKEESRMMQLLTQVLKMKAIMLKRNLSAASHKCPWCAGHWHARLLPSRRFSGGKAIHMWCDGVNDPNPCKSQLME